MLNPHPGELGSDSCSAITGNQQVDYAQRSPLGTTKCKRATEHVSHAMRPTRRNEADPLRIRFALLLIREKSYVGHWF